MLLSSEYESIIAPCREKYNRGECQLSECYTCPTIHTAYFFRNYAIPNATQIEGILTEKKNGGIFQDCEKV